MWCKIRSGLCLLGLAVWIVAGVMAVVYLPRMSAPLEVSAAQAFTRAEFITIILTAVTVVLTVLAILLAVAGFYGYIHIRDSAHEIATREARETARSVACETAGPVAAREARAAVMATTVATRDEETTTKLTEALSDDDQHD